VDTWRAQNRFKDDSNSNLILKDFKKLTFN